VALAFAERRHLRSVAASGRAAEQPAVRLRAIDEPERAPSAGAALDELRLLGRDQRGDLCRDQRDQFIRCLNAVAIRKPKPVRRRYELLIALGALERTVQAP